MTEANEIRTGIEYESDVPTKADVYSFADDGEHATVWAVNRVSDDEVDVLYFRCEAGLIDSDGPIESFEIDPDVSTEEFARELANADPEEAINLARDYWTDE